MDPSPSVSENGTASATPDVSTFQLEASGCVQSPRKARAEHFAWLIERKIRDTLQDNGLRTNRIEPRYSRAREGRLRRQINVTMTCLVECTMEEIERVSREVELAMQHLPTGRVRLRDSSADWNE